MPALAVKPNPCELSIEFFPQIPLAYRISVFAPHLAGRNLKRRGPSNPNVGQNHWQVQFARRHSLGGEAIIMHQVRRRFNATTSFWLCAGQGLDRDVNSWCIGSPAMVVIWMGCSSHEEVHEFHLRWVFCAASNGGGPQIATESKNIALLHTNQIIALLRMARTMRL